MIALAVTWMAKAGQEEAVAELRGEPITPPTDPKADHGLRYLYANGVEMFHNNFKAPDGKDRDGVHFVGESGTIHVNFAR